MHKLIAEGIIVYNSPLCETSDLIWFHNMLHQLLLQYSEHNQIMKCTQLWYFRSP